MKAIFFIIALFTVIFVNSQVLRIKVYETVEYVNHDTIGVLSATSSILEPVNINRGNCEYVIDLTNKTDKFFRDGVLETEADITFVNDGSLFIINFLYEGFDVGVVINTDIQNETFDWFSKTGDFYDIAKATNFEIIKSQ
jgi:hypothetical protein